MESDLKLCLVRPAPATFERTCCFELVTPTKYLNFIHLNLNTCNNTSLNHLLQADSDTLCNAWMRALQRTIHYLHENDDTVFQLTTVKQINDGTSESGSTLQHDSFLTELRRIPGNEICADCCVEYPKWASINLGVLLCIECCGIHRSFGVQISKVRSLIMDTLEPEQKKVLLALGNRAVNSIYLAHIPSVKIIPPRPVATSSRYLTF
ncbi:unnamed protein product [Onchocerca flexuosa]|uniref:Arf-GAP domain-containing protein n=1 Tax=Onchocerca flexuosa TaxID=387005 RepID=A0A183HRH6_9BILA|nr:unnamed protein product [Onchocerca flexuosa]